MLQTQPRPGKATGSLLRRKPPLLLAITAHGSLADVGRLGAQLLQFQAETAILGTQVAVLLRDPLLPPETLHARISALPWSSLVGLRLGLRLPATPDFDLAEELLQFPFDFMHLPDDPAADAWRSRQQDRPELAWSRAWHPNAHSSDRSGSVDRVQLLELPGGIDWAVVSPLWPTPSKPGQTPLTPAGLARFAANTAVPLVALGGIDADNCLQALASGALGVACLRAAWQQTAALTACLHAWTLGDGNAPMDGPGS